MSAVFSGQLYSCFPFLQVSSNEKIYYQPLQIIDEAERHFSQSKKEDDDDEDDDKGSSKNGKAKIIVKLKMSPPADF